MKARQHSILHLERIVGNLFQNWIMAGLPVLQPERRNLSAGSIAAPAHAGSKMLDSVAGAGDPSAYANASG